MVSAVLLVFILAGFTDAHVCSAAVHVKGYYRKDGTYVRPHYRSSPDGNPYNNWSFPGNVNPYTGEVAPGDPDTYLRNYYGSPPQVSTPPTPRSPTDLVKPTMPEPTTLPPPNQTHTCTVKSLSVCTATLTDAWTTAEPTTVLSSDTRVLGVRLILSDPSTSPVQCAWYHVKDGQPVLVSALKNESTGYDAYYFTLTYPEGSVTPEGQWKAELQAGSVSATVPFFVSSAEEPERLRLVIAGQQSDSEDPVVVLDNKAYVRAVMLVEALGYHEDWMPSLEMLVARSENHEIVIKAGWTKAAVDGTITELPSAPMMVNNLIYVPVDAIQTLLDRKAVFDAEQDCVTVSAVEDVSASPQ